MANCCFFSMLLKGEKENVSKFMKALGQEGSVWMGRGACFNETMDDYDEENHSIFVNGECKWSIVSALIDNAFSMRETPERWSFGNREPASLTFITLFEACEKYHVNMEVYSEECGLGFQEHFKYENGVILDDCVDCYEYSLEDYESKEEAEKELGISISDEEWKEQYAKVGGYEWYFELADVSEVA